jgi:hypothetical protein
MTTIKGKGIKVTTGIKAGSLNPNHNRMTVSVKVKSGLKAGTGIVHFNHNTRPVCCA